MIPAKPNTVQGPAGTLLRNLCCKSRSRGHHESHELQLAQALRSFRTLDQRSYLLLSYGITARVGTSGLEVLRT